MGELEHHPRLAQRERRLEQMLIEYLELAGIETVEGANGRDFLLGLGERSLGWHGAPPILAIVK